MAFQQPGIELPFTNGFYNSRSLQFSSQRCINYRPNIAEQPSLSRESLYMTPGEIEIISNTGQGSARGSHTMAGLLYIVRGDALYRIDKSGGTFTETNLGLLEGSGRVIMVSGRGSFNRKTLIIVVPGFVTYYYNTDTGIFGSLDGNTNFLSPAQDVVEINGFFTFLQTGTNIVFHSNLNDAELYNALDFQLVNQTENAVGLTKYRNQMYVMGDEQTIPFTFIGGSNFVFQQQPNSIQDIGLRAVFAKTNIRQSFCFLGQGRNEQPSIWLFRSVYTKISTEAIDFVIQNLNEDQLNESFIMNYSQGGGEFIIFIGGNECFVYDLKSGKWHERRSRINSQDKRWRVSCISQAYNKLIVGDYEDGKIGILDENTFTEYGTPIFRSFSTQPFDNKGKAIQVKDVLIALDHGFNGEVSMDFSDDGGFNWSDNLIRSAGLTGEYGIHNEFDRLGSASFSRVLRFGTSSPVNCNINKLLAIA